MDEQLAPTVNVKSYIRNGRVVRASQRRGRQGRGLGSAVASTAARAAGEAAKKPLVDSYGKVGGLPVPKGGAYGEGIWANPDGSIYGYAMEEDGRITKTKPPGWDQAHAAKPSSLTKAPSKTPRRGRGKLGGGIAGGRP